MGLSRRLITPTGASAVTDSRQPPLPSPKASWTPIPGSRSAAVRVREERPGIVARTAPAPGAGDSVTRPDLEAALAGFKTELLERLADSDQRMADLKVELLERIAESEGTLRAQMAENDRSLRAQMAENDQTLRERIAGGERALIDRIAESERRTAALLWRLFDGIVAVAGVARYLPAGSVSG